jgi:hypothetical protein
LVRGSFEDGFAELFENVNDGLLGVDEYSDKELKRILARFV